MATSWKSYVSWAGDEEMIQRDEGYYAMAARNVPGIQEKLAEGRVAVAGLGGLGSNIAVMLARIGVGSLLLMDYDVVEPSNLNRQHYNVTHMGVPKTEALKEQIGVINPYVAVDIRTVKVTAENAAELCRGYPVVCEAFDNPSNKAALVNALLEDGGYKVVAASGMTGMDSANRIQTKRTFQNLYVCGDAVAAERAGVGFMAPRVMVCAGHQANMALRLLLGREEE